MRIRPNELAQMLRQVVRFREMPNLVNEENRIPYFGKNAAHGLEMLFGFAFRLINDLERAVPMLAKERHQLARLPDEHGTRQRVLSRPVAALQYRVKHQNAPRFRYQALGGETLSSARLADDPRDAG